MRDYVIVTDSTTDLPMSIIRDLDVNILPLTYELDGKNYKDRTKDNDVDMHEFYNKLREGKMAKTSLVNAQSFIDCFEEILSSERDVLYIGFSSALSGTFHSAEIAKEELSEKYSNGKIICIDTKAASMGEGLLVYRAIMKQREGVGIEELEGWIYDNMLHVCHWFTVDDLNHLKRGGRLSAISAAIGTALNLKPILKVNNLGSLVADKKVRGRKKAIQTLVECMEQTILHSEEQDIFIGHGDTLEEAQYLERLIRETCNVRNVFIGHIGPVIGSHTGPGILAVLYFGSER